MQNNLNFLKVKKTKNSLASPIDPKLVNEVVCENQLLPLGLKYKLKFYTKKFFKIGFFYRVFIMINVIISFSFQDQAN